MSRQNPDTEELLSLLSHNSLLESRTMISICDPPKPMGAWQPQGDPYPLGVLAVLPVELLHELLERLDLRSITRFSRVSIQGRIAVQSLPGYRDLMSHAPHALEALSQTRMICHHTASQLIAAFRTDQCTICSAFGPYLHLMTCERVCWQCLVHNRTLRVIPRETASEAFALSGEQVRQLPTILTIPGRYGGTQTPNIYRYNLVSVRAAIELGISVHGSLESLSEAFRGRTHPGILAYEIRDLQAALDVVASGKYDALFTQLEDRHMFRLGPEDWHFGKATIPFPSRTSSGLVEDGLFCKGCQWTLKQKRRFPEFPVDTMVPPGCDPRPVLSGLKMRAYSRIGLLEHIRHCYGANQLISSWKDGN